MRQGNKYSKLFIKVYDKNKNVYRWSHLCYVNTNLLNTFIAQNPSLNINEKLKDWYKEDFGRVPTINTLEDVKVLKDIVKERYRGKYPEVYRDSYSDRQGWFRVWISEKMSDEVKYGKISV